jgi:hypothetical protein
VREPGFQTKQESKLDCVIHRNRHWQFDSLWSNWVSQAWSRLAGCLD